MQLPAGEHTAGKAGVLQPRPCGGIPHRPHFAGNTREREQGEPGLRRPDHAWRSAGWVGQHLGPLWEQRLATRAGGGFSSTTARFGEDVGPHLRPFLHGDTEGCSDGFRGEVIRGGSETTGGDQHAGALRRLPHERDQTLAVIPQHRLAVMGQAEAGQPFPDPTGVSIQDVAQEQLRTDTEQLNAAALGRFKHGFGEWANDATSALP